MDLNGQSFARLTVLFRDRTKTKRTYWLCKCSCGNIISVQAPSLRNGHTRSCGCLKNELSSKRLIEKETTHNGSKTRLYGIWSDIKKRCNNPNSWAYRWYGGKGVKVCAEWLTSFENFRQWSIENGYSDNLTIDRINTNGNYEPSNCRWVEMKIQGNNKSNNVRMSVNGEIHTIPEWHDITGINKSTLYERFYKGMSEEDFLSKDKYKVGKRR